MSAWRRITPEEPGEWDEVRLWVPEFFEPIQGFHAPFGLPVTGFRSAEPESDGSPRFIMNMPSATGDDIILHPTHWQPLEEGPEEYS